MINRLKGIIEEPEERPPASDHFEIVCDGGIYYVARDEAMRIVALLNRRWPPRWIRVTDAFGAELRILLRTITAVCESSEAQRQRERNFRKARRSEERRDRTWDDDWW